MPRKSAAARTATVPSAPPAAADHLVPASAIDADDPRPAGWWVSADQRTGYNMTGLTRSQAIASLLEQCADQAERDWVLAGSFDALRTH